MSFVSLGDGSTRPTFFEMVAADRLMASLKAATIYSLSVPLPPSQTRTGSDRLQSPMQNTPPCWHRAAFRIKCVTLRRFGGHRGVLRSVVSAGFCARSKSCYRSP